MSEDTGIDRAEQLARAMVAAPWKRGDEWIVDLMDVDGCGHRLTLYPARNEEQIAAITEDAARWIERIIDRAHRREATLTAERDEARAWVRRITAADRVLTCVYCGEAYPPGTPDHGAETLTAHVRVCAKHPMREAEAEIARLRASMESHMAAHAEDAARIDSLRATVDGLRIRADLANVSRNNGAPR